MNENTLTLNETTYNAVPATISPVRLAGKAYPSCHGCAFYEELLSCDEAKRLSPCVCEYRKDGKNIIWVKA